MWLGWKKLGWRKWVVGKIGRDDYGPPRAAGLGNREAEPGGKVFMCGCFARATTPGAGEKCGVPIRQSTRENLRKMGVCDPLRRRMTFHLIAARKNGCGTRKMCLSALIVGAHSPSEWLRARRITGADFPICAQEIRHWHSWRFGKRCDESSSLSDLMTGARGSETLRAGEREPCLMQKSLADSPDPGGGGFLRPAMFRPGVFTPRPGPRRCGRAA